MNLVMQLLLMAVTYIPGGASCSSLPCTASVTCATSACPAQGNIDTALASSANTITIQSGVTWTNSSTITLPANRTSVGGSTVITSDLPDSMFPPEGTRITNLYAPLMPNLQITGTQAFFTSEQTSNSIHDYTFKNLLFTTVPGKEITDMIRIWVTGTCVLSGKITDASGTPIVITYTGGSSGCYDDGSRVSIDGVYGNQSANGWFLVSNPSHSTTQMTLLNYDGTNTDSGGRIFHLWDSTTTFNANDGGLSNCSGSTKPYLALQTNTNVSPCTLAPNWCLIGTGTCGNSLNYLALDSPTVMQQNAQWNVNQTANNIAFKHVIVKPGPLTMATKGFRLVGTNITVEDSLCDDVKAQNDSQCAAHFGDGFTYKNNAFFGGPGEHMIAGGLITNFPYFNGNSNENYPITGLTATLNAFYNNKAKYKYDNWPQNTWLEAGVIKNGNLKVPAIASYFVTATASTTIPNTMDNGVTSGVSCNATLTSTPTIAAGTFVNQVVFISNIAAGSSNCVLQDNGTLVGSLLSLTTPPSVTIPGQQSLEFQWNGSLWVQVGSVTASGTATNYVALNSGTTGTTVPSFPVSTCAQEFQCDGTCCVTDGTVVWTKNPYVSNANITHKNAIEFKVANSFAGINIVKWNTIDTTWVGGQAGAVLSFKGSNQGIAGTATVSGLKFTNNIARNNSIFLVANSSGDFGYGAMNNLEVSNNLSLGGGQNYGTNVTNQVVGRSSTALYLAPPYITGFKYNHNTIVPSTDATGGNFLFSECTAATGNGTMDAPEVKYNMFKWDSLAISLYGPCPGTLQGKAIMDAVTNGLGAYTFAGNKVNSGPTWPTGNVTTAWSSIKFAGNTYALDKSDPLKGTADSGTDPGVDYSQLAMITSLTTYATDKMALIQYTVSNPAASTPCVLEFSTARDFSSYVPDLNPLQYTTPDADSNSWLPNYNILTNVNVRYLLVGKNQPLTPSTTYWYRLHCGGDFNIGSVTTAAAYTRTLTGVTLDTRPPVTGATQFQVLYGNQYNKATDTISGGGTYSKTCAYNTNCSSYFNIAPGPAYYQISYKDVNGNVLSKTPTTMLLATGS